MLNNEGWFTEVYPRHGSAFSLKVIEKLADKLNKEAELRLMDAIENISEAFVLWDKTRGANKVRGMMPLSSSSVLVLTTDPRIKTIRDFTDKDRIAVSAVKVTAQAIALQMAAAKEWGWDQRFRLDSLLVSMSNPDAMAAVLGGHSEIKTHASIIPFSVIEMESGKVHQVMTSADYLDPGSTTVVMSATAASSDPSPTARRVQTAPASIRLWPSRRGFASPRRNRASSTS